MFLIAEPLILVLGLAVALARDGPLAVAGAGPACWPSVYTDLFRGIPTILLVLLFGFGMPALQLQGVPNSLFFWSLVALVLSYGAYVAEVFRAGIESIHPSQIASADALGPEPRPDDAARRRTAGRAPGDPAAAQRLRLAAEGHRAGRRRSALFDAVFSARDYANYNFNYTPYVVVAGFFVVLTIPLARFTDWLQRRMAERERAGAL